MIRVEAISSGDRGAAVPRRVRLRWNRAFRVRVRVKVSKGVMVMVRVSKGARVRVRIKVRG